MRPLLSQRGRLPRINVDWNLNHGCRRGVHRRPGAIGPASPAEMICPSRDFCVPSWMSFRCVRLISPLVDVQTAILRLSSALIIGNNNKIWERQLFWMKILFGKATVKLRHTWSPIFFPCQQFCRFPDAKVMQIMHARYYYDHTNGDIAWRLIFRARCIDQYYG